ncbi:sigma-70 family RNA polymerase sigma factor [Acidovorax sp. Be4]|uniref:Sigma-70 family RNA polymerase sigma factor n=1 Tax=Acidovorax bellezanensis TaxID=2976702 RepID=A0ABT2PIC4_9BURK|nr:sigma-70 family RNA polymerase sigma factor [Acidovorax sp. Be4]MCT9809928.1 sigma-70 family RNA polymerase sigma factor [Acidovorax sp. Be4]
MAGAQPHSSSHLHTLYSDHHGWLVHWLHRRVHCVQEAADLAQDTFVRLLKQCPAELQEPRAFLATVARSVLIDHCRRMSLERAYLQTLMLMPEPVSPSPEERAVVLQALEQIDRMLDGLGARARSAFLLAQLDGLTYKEIAQRLGVSLSSVEKYMAAALTHCYRIVYQDAAA